MQKTNIFKKRGKSRLPNNKLEKAVCWELFVVMFLWIAVYCSFEGVMVADKAQAYKYQPPVIVEKEVVKVVKTARVTAYSCGGLTTEAEITMNCPSLRTGGPRTANGTTPIANKTMACDSANMGKTFELEGYGEVTCTDTGGAIKGAGRFDLYVENVAEAYAYGVQYLEYSEVIN